LFLLFFYVILVSIQSLDQGCSALYRAAQSKRVKLAKLLIDKGSKVDFQDTAGVTPLFIASQQGHADIVKLLISHGANVNCKIKRTQTSPLYIAGFHFVYFIYFKVLCSRNLFIM
jgi:ankyrin repeat protein